MLDLCIYGCYKMTDEGLIGFKRGSCLCRLNTSGCYKITDSGTRYLIQVLQLPHTCIAATSCTNAGIALPHTDIALPHPVLRCLIQYCAASSSIALPHTDIALPRTVLHSLTEAAGARRCLMYFRSYTWAAFRSYTWAAFCSYTWAAFCSYTWAAFCSYTAFYSAGAPARGFQVGLWGRGSPVSRQPGDKDCRLCLVLSACLVTG